MASRIVPCLLLLLIAVPQLFAQNPQRKAEIAGKITNGPAAKVTIKLLSVGFNSRSEYDGYAVNTETDGSFRIQDIDPGQYRLTAEAPGFVPAEYGPIADAVPTRILSLAPGQRLRGIRLTLTASSTICGKLLGPDGAPVQGGVDAGLHLPGIALLEHLRGARAPSDAQGNFRIAGLPPGEYYLLGLASGGRAWFPSTQVFNDAQPIIVSADANSDCNKNIRLISTSFSVRDGFHVRGKIIGLQPEPSLGRVSLQLAETDSIDGPFEGVLIDVEKSDQEFDFQVVRAGVYELILRGGVYDTWSSGTHPKPWFLLSSQKITITDTDVNDVKVEARSASLSGRILFDGASKQQSCPTNDVQYISIQKKGDGQYQEAQISSDGTFSFRHVDPGAYTVSIFPVLPRTVSIASVVLDGKSVADSTLDLSALQESNLTVTLTTTAVTGTSFRSPTVPAFERLRKGPALRSGEISGRILNAAGAEVTVSLKSLRFNSRASYYGYTVQAQADGTFRIPNVDPGLYVLGAKAPGFIASQYGAQASGLQGTPFSMTLGQKITGLSLRLQQVPSGSICGRVTSENGRPVRGAEVYATSGTASYQVSGPPNSSNSNYGIVHADDTGKYRISNLQPGMYVVHASGPSSAAYYPSSPSFNAAQLVQTTNPEAEACSADVRIIQNRTARHFQVRGHVRGSLTPTLGAFFYVSVTAINPSGIEAPSQGFFSSSRSAFLVQSDQSFELPEVLPGDYRIRLYGSFGCNFLAAGSRITNPQTNNPQITISTICTGNGAGFQPTVHLLGSANFSIAGNDIDDLVLEQTPLSSVSGRVEFTGDSKKITDQTNRRTIVLQDEARRQQLGATLAPDGTFSFPALDPGAYTIVFAPDFLANGLVYATTASFDGQPIQYGKIVIAPQSAHEIRIVLGTGTGQLETEVTPSELPHEEYSDEPCKRRLIGGFYPSNVFVVPEVPPVLGSGILRGSFHGENLPFSTELIPPGRYRVLAGENLFFNQTFYRESENLAVAAAASLGVPIEIRSGENSKITIRNSTVEIQNIRARSGDPLVRSDYDDSVFLF